MQTDNSIYLVSFDKYTIVTSAPNRTWARNHFMSTFGPVKDSRRIGITVLGASQKRSGVLFAGQAHE